ncbi:MAG: penicillin acylase family protein [Verrucomicrobiales bacterium]|nr:penicillin acylase family protein [Verrucomicrobiales bacterium]
MSLPRCRVWSCLAIVCVLCVAKPAWGAPRAEYGRIEWITDSWGIPHAFSSTDAGALYALGYATADQRGFQMTYALRIIQGRLSEIVGHRPKEGRRETSVDSDRLARTIGWEAAAVRTAKNLDGKTFAWLQAYCEGVNDSFEHQRAEGRLHPLFARFGLHPEPWRPADCLLSWWHLAQFFASDGTRDLLAWKTRQRADAGRPAMPEPGQAWFDDAAAVVQESEVSRTWLRRANDFAASRGVLRAIPDQDGPKFSHAWVVGGERTSTGAAVLVSDPQTPVRDPSLWMEFHLSGKTLDVRGVGVPGCPGLLIGFNRHVAWGLTALGADQADLFRLETDAAHPNAYRWDGTWRPMQVRQERIHVKSGDDVVLEVRETHLGPVLSEFSFRQANDPEVALKRVPLCDSDRDTLQAVFAMMTSTSTKAFLAASRAWRFPSANCVVGDRRGAIGYAVLGAIPVRARHAADKEGGEAQTGSGDAHDWQGFVPAEWLPQVLNPNAGYLLSANHRPIGSFYRVPLGLSTGSLGDTLRSWRLRERLSALSEWTPEQVLQIHFDDTNPARREIVRLGSHLRRRQADTLSDDARRALEVLEPWLADGARSDLGRDGARLATRLSTFFRFVATPLARRYGGGESGLARFLKTTSARVEADPGATLDDQESEFIDRVLAEAWRENDGGDGRERGRATGGGGNAANHLPWFGSLDGFGSLDPSRDLIRPNLACIDGQTLRSQAAQSYTQWVPLHDVDAARSICPIGHSDRPDSAYRASTMELWATSRLHQAPLSRRAVDAIATDRRALAP